MEGPRWERIQNLFHAALRLPPEQWRGFLKRECGDDEESTSEALAMLEEHSRGTSIFDRKPGESALSNDELLAAIPREEFGPYRITGELGRGGMGVVFRAEREDGNPVAIKVLSDWWVSPERRRRFAIEQKALAKLEQHPSIAHLYHADTLSGGTPWFAMEFIEGVHLDAYCRERGCPVKERLVLFRRVCEPVQYAHQLGYVHRDLKPSNILVKEDGTVKLLDFGITKQLENPEEGVTRAGQRCMTLPYAAPEQVLAEPAGTYSDIYSLGVILYELLAGKPPFDLSTRTQAEAEKVVVQQDPEKPSQAARETGRFPQAGRSAWNDLDQLCLKAMRKKPHDRFESVGELIGDVDHYLNNEPLKAGPDSFGYWLGKFVIRNLRAVAATSLAFISIVALVTFFTVRVARESDRANRETARTAAMNRFLADDLLEQTDPFRSEHSKELFVDVVNQASPRIDLQFKADPATAARLHQTLGRAFEGRYNFPRARQEYGRAEDLFRKAEGPLSQDAIQVRLQRALMEAGSYESGSLATAKSLVAGAAAMVSGVSKPREDLEVWLLTARGYIAMIAADTRSANENFSAALRRADAISSFDEADRGRIKEDLAISLIHSGDGAKAELLLRRLVKDFSAIRGPDSAGTLRVRAYLSQALQIQHKYADAIRETNALYPLLVGKLGEGHQTVMTILGTRAASEGSLGMWDDATRDDLTMHDIAVQNGRAPGFFSIASLSDAALSQCFAERYAQGEPKAREAFQQASMSFGPRAGLTGGTSYALAVCLTGLNRLDEASALLKNIDVKAVAALSADSGIDASIAVVQGEIAARRGDYVLAQHYLDVAAPAINKPDAAAGERESLMKLRRAISAHQPPNGP